MLIYNGLSQTGIYWETYFKPDGIFSTFANSEGRNALNMFWVFGNNHLTFANFY